MRMESSILLSTEAYHTNRASRSAWDTTSVLGYIALSLAGCALLTVMANGTGSGSDLWTSTATVPTSTASVAHGLQRFPQHRPSTLQARAYGAPEFEVVSSFPPASESSPKTSSAGLSVEGQKQMFMAFGGIALGAVFAMWKWYIPFLPIF